MDSGEVCSRKDFRAKNGALQGDSRDLPCVVMSAESPVSYTHLRAHETVNAISYAVFCFENFEICFEKQDCWFSMEIEIHKGHNSLNMIDDGKDILNDFDVNTSVTIERTIVEIVGNLK